MRIVVTGAAGFVGNRLLDELQSRGVLDGRPIAEVVAVDRVEPRISDASVKTTPILGDLRDAAVLDRIFAAPVDALFHLAATMTADAERDFDAGLSFNLLGLVEILERCRRGGGTRLVFSSSNAAFGGDLPDVVPDGLPQRPQSSYGVQKVIGELLLDDYTRRGFLDGRGLRLPTVLLRPASNSKTLSTRMSAVVSEPLAGRPVVCPFSPGTRIPAASVGAVARGLVRLFELDDAAIGPVRTMNFTALSVSFADMVTAVERRIGDRARDLIRWELDPEADRIVSSMAGGLVSCRGRAAGITADPSFDAIIDDYLSGGRPA